MVGGILESRLKKQLVNHAPNRTLRVYITSHLCSVRMHPDCHKGEAETKVAPSHKDEGRVRVWMTDGTLYRMPSVLQFRHTEH